MTYAKWAVIGQGNNGVVLQYGPKSVVKYTVDPIEAAAWIAVLAGQEHHGGQPLPGLPLVQDVQVGNRFAVITREDAPPLPKGEFVLRPRLRAAFSRPNWLHTAGRLSRQADLVTLGRRGRQAVGGLRDMAGLQWASRFLDQTAFGAHDLRGDNIGQTDHGAVLVDPGRTPLESLIVGNGELGRTCPNQSAMVAAVKRALGHAPSYRGCSIVGDKAMRAVMHKHGWKDADIDGTAGFHTEDQQILIREGDEWSLLHELFHAARITDRSLGSAIVEGLTEACAQDTARANGKVHHPTYPDEVRTVRKLCHTLGVKPLDLGRRVADNPEKIGHTLAIELGQRLGISPGVVYKTIGVGVSDPTKLANLLRAHS